MSTKYQLRSSTTPPSLVVTNTGTITKFERTVSFGWPLSLSCAKATAVTKSSKTKVQTTFIDPAQWSTNNSSETGALAEFDCKSAA